MNQWKRWGLLSKIVTNATKQTCQHPPSWIFQMLNCILWNEMSLLLTMHIVILQANSILYFTDLDNTFHMLPFGWFKFEISSDGKIYFKYWMHIQRQLRFFFLKNGSWLFGLGDHFGKFRSQMTPRKKSLLYALYIYLKSLKQAFKFKNVFSLFLLFNLWSH